MSRSTTKAKSSKAAKSAPQEPRAMNFGPFPIYNLMVTSDMRRDGSKPRHSFVLHTEIELKSKTEADTLRAHLTAGRYDEAYTLLAKKDIIRTAKASARNALKLAITAS